MPEVSIPAGIIEIVVVDGPISAGPGDVVIVDGPIPPGPVDIVVDGAISAVSIEIVIDVAVHIYVSVYIHIAVIAAAPRHTAARPDIDSA